MRQKQPKPLLHKDIHDENDFGWSRAKLGQLRIEVHDIERGMTMIVCWAANVIGPIAFVWGDLDSKGNFEHPYWETHGSYVIPNYRRLRIRATIDNYILSHLGAASIRTNFGSEHGGLGYLTARYKKCEEAHCWVLTK